MNILEEIIASKRKEVTERKELYPVKLLEKSIYYPTQPVSLKKYLLREDLNGIIAEFKRKSPSKGFINQYANCERTSVGYMKAGASALSILTDQIYFGGQSSDLTTARKFNYCPILRKDFIIDEYQIIEAKSIGADAILLLANVLSKEEINTFSKLAHSLGMECLLELRDLEETKKIGSGIELVGVNNRDLKTFTTNIEQSYLISKEIGNTHVKISESGLTNGKIIAELYQAGFSGFLIGEYFMKDSRPEKVCEELIKEIKTEKALLKYVNH